jgi:hypothetical protein
MLRDAVKVPSTDYRKTNNALKEVILKIKASCPDKFHDARSLKYRVFWDEPKNLPSKMYDYYINRAPR